MIDYSIFRVSEIMFKNFSKFFYLGVDSQTPSNDVRRFVLLNTIVFISLFFLFTFAMYNLFFTYRYIIAAIDFLAFFIFLYALYSIKQEQKFMKAAVIVSINSFILLLALVYYIKGAEFTLVWVLFFPIIAIFVLGCQKGLFLSLFFYSLILYIAYNGVDSWLNGMWNIESFARFVAANTGMLFITYFFERSFEAAHRELAKNRSIEQRYIIALKKASITDPLTQLYNRRHLDTMFHEKFLKAKENNSYFAFFILDIDHFKDYNDNYGHIAGDGALKEVAAVLQELMRREADSVFRLGGEEFAGILMADSEEKIIHVIENIRSTIESLAIEHCKSTFGFITVSIGVCIIHSFEEESLDKMYKIADSVLYEAKNNGRNQIRIARISTL